MDVVSYAYAGEAAAEAESIKKVNTVHDFVASGTLSTGDTVILNADGTVSVVSGTISNVPTFGAEAVFNSGTTLLCSTVYDSVNNKIVVSYRDSSNLDYGTAIVGTVSGDTISFGTPVVFYAGGTWNLTSTFDSTNGKVVISYLDGDNSSYGTAIVGTVSGTDISFGTAVVYNSAAVGYLAIAFDSTNGKVVIVYKDGGNSDYPTAIVGTVSGTDISFGTAVVINVAVTGANYATFDSTNGKVVISYMDGNNSNYGTSVVGTVSGTDITFGTPVVFVSGAINQGSMAFDSTNGKVIIAYRDGGNLDYGTAIVGTVSGTDITFGTPTVFNSNGRTYPTSTVYDSANERIAVFYDDYSNADYGTVAIGTVSGTDITFGTPVIFNSDATTYISSAYDPISGKVVTSYKDGGNLDYGTAIVSSTLSVSSNNADFIGFAQNNALDTEEITVALTNSVDGNQSGLTQEDLYYVGADGALVTTDSGVLVGKALSSSALLIQGGKFA